jgi:hypothetical protein
MPGSSTSFSPPGAWPHLIAGTSLSSSSQSLSKRSRFAAGRTRSLQRLSLFRTRRNLPPGTPRVVGSSCSSSSVGVDVGVLRGSHPSWIPGILAGSSHQLQLRWRWLIDRLRWHRLRLRPSSHKSLLPGAVEELFLPGCQRRRRSSAASDWDFSGRLPTRRRRAMELTPGR